MNNEKHLYTIREMNIEDYLLTIDPSFSSDTIIDPFDYVSSPPPTVADTTDRGNTPTNPILFRIDQNAENTNTADQGIQLQQQLKHEESVLEIKKQQCSLVGAALDVAKNLENVLEMEASTQSLKDRITKLEQSLEFEKKNRCLAEEALDIVTKNLEQESDRESNTLSLKDQINTLQQKLEMEKKNRSVAEQALGMVTKNLENERELETIGLASHDNQLSSSASHNMEDPEMEMVTVTGDMVKSELQIIVQEENSKMFDMIKLLLSESNEVQRNFECGLRDELSSIKSEIQDIRNVYSFQVNQLKATYNHDGAEGHNSNEIENESAMTTQHILDVNTPNLATPENKVVRYPVHCHNLTPMPERSLVEAPSLNFPTHNGDDCNSIAIQGRLAGTTKLLTIEPRQAEVQNASRPRNQGAQDTPVPWNKANAFDSTSFDRVPMSIDMTGRLVPAVRYFTFNNDSGGHDGSQKQQSDSQQRFGDQSRSADSAAELLEDCDTPRKSKEAIRLDNKADPPASITSSSVPAQVFRSSRYYTKYLVSSCPKLMRGKYKWSMLFSSCTKRRSSPTVRSPPSTSNSLRRLATINSKTAFGIVATESVSDFSDFRCPVVFLYEDGDVYADGDFHTSKLFFQGGDQVTFTLDLLMMEGTTGGTLSAAVNDSDNVVLASNLNTLLGPNEGFFPVVWLNRHKNAKFFGFEEILTEI